MSELKIAMLVRQFSPHGGLELYAHKVVEGLLANGVAVTVCCQENFSELQDKHLSFRLFAAEKASGKRARLAALFTGANQALADLDVDLIHSQHCPTALADVVTFHNHSSSRLSEVGIWWEKALNESKRRLVPAYRLRNRQDEILLRRASCLIFPAEIMKDDFFANFPFLQGPPSKPYVVAHPGASLMAAACRQESSSGNRVSGSPGGATHGIAPTGESVRGSDPAGEPSEQVAFNFLFVGRGFRKKGLDVLLQACSFLKQKGSRKFNLLIAGLSEKPLDRMRLKLLGLQDCVKYLGFQKDMDAVYARAGSIILPSRVEPFGMAPVQAMQRGLVPIVSKVSGVAEVLHDGQDALILNNHLNAQELAGLMDKLMNEQGLLQRLSANALSTAARVSWPETVNQTLKAYEIALAVKSGKTTE